MTSKQINRYLNRIKTNDPKKQEFIERVVPALSNPVIMRSVDMKVRYLCPYCNNTYVDYNQHHRAQQTSSFGYKQELTIVFNLNSKIENDDITVRTINKITSFTSYYTLKRHLTENHSKNLPCNREVFDRSPITHACTICCLTFTRKEHYQKHLQKVT